MNKTTCRLLYITKMLRIYWTKVQRLAVPCHSMANQLCHHFWRLLAYIDLVFLGYNDQDLTYIEIFKYILKSIKVREKIDYCASRGEIGQHLLLPQVDHSRNPGKIGGAPQNGWCSRRNIENFSKTFIVQLCSGLVQF